MKKIDLGRAIKAIAEIAAIVGIALLAYELHQNNELLETQASLARLQNRVGATTLMATDSELAAAVIKDKAGEPLSNLEAFKIENEFTATLVKWEWEYRQYTSGVDAESPAEDWRAVVRSFPVIRRLWADDKFKRRFSPQFVQFMNEEIVVPGAPAPTPKADAPSTPNPTVASDLNAPQSGQP
jgi:hypothetical protein